MRSGGGRRDGFSLIEGLIAITLISVILVALAPVMFHVTTQQTVETAQAELESVLVGEANRLASIPFTSLAAQEGCTSIPAHGRFSHTRCVEVQTLSPRTRRVVVTVASASELVDPDSMALVRTRPRTNPFNTSHP